MVIKNCTTSRSNKVHTIDENYIAHARVDREHIDVIRVQQVGVLQL